MKTKSGQCLFDTKSRFKKTNKVAHFEAKRLQLHHDLSKK